MRARTRARPQLEALESMTLLSGVAAAAVHRPHAEVAAVNNGPTTPGTTITLSGTERGLYFARQQNPDTGKQYSFTAVGRVSPLGLTFSTGSFHTPGFILNGMVDGSLTLRAPRGLVNVMLSGPAQGPSAGVFDLTYTITGGTRNFANDKGTGPVEVTVRPFGSGSVSSRRGEVGRITLNFGAMTTTV